MYIFMLQYIKYLGTCPKSYYCTDNVLSQLKPLTQNIIHANKIYKTA